MHGGGDGEAGDVVGALDPEAPVAAPRRRLHVAGLAEHPAQVVPGGGQRGDELEGVLGAGAVGDAPDMDAAVLVRGEDPPARGRQRLEQLLAARRSSNAASASAWEPRLNSGAAPPCTLRAPPAPPRHLRMGPALGEGARRQRERGLTRAGVLLCRLPLRRNRLAAPELLRRC